MREIPPAFGPLTPPSPRAPRGARAKGSLAGIAVILSLALLPSSTLASGKKKAAVRDALTQQRDFADELFDGSEYFRASTEYLRLLSFWPAIPDADSVRFRVAQCSYRAGRYDDASRHFIRLAAATSSTDMVDRCRLVIAACEYRQNDWRAAAEECSRSAAASPSSPLLDRLKYLEGMSRMHLGRWSESFGAFSAVPRESPLAPSSRELGGLAARAEKTRPASPGLSAGLSLIVPGLGQTLNGYVWDGVTAFILSAGSLAIGIYGSSQGNRATETVGYALFAVWHSANVYGGASAARRANRRTHEGIMEKAEAISQLSLD